MSDSVVRLREKSERLEWPTTGSLAKISGDTRKKNEAHIIFSQSQGISKNNKLWLYMEQIKQKGCLFKGIKWMCSCWDEELLR